MIKQINLASDFSKFPGGRFASDGPHSGEEFRERVLVPALASGANISLNLDGVAGLPASFLEEAFGGLVRVHHIPVADLRRRLVVVTTSRLSHYADLIWQYIDAESERNKLN